MARIRSLHPGYRTDEAIVSCSPFARLCWIGLLMEADDGGVFEWKPITLKMQIFPADHVDMVALLAELTTADMIKQYSLNGRQYGAIRNFCRFQRPRKPKSVHPIPVELRTYVASDAVSSEFDDDEGAGVSPPDKAQQRRVPKKSEPHPPDSRQVNRKSEKSPQMEDGGWRKKEPTREINPHQDRDQHSPLDAGETDDWGDA